MSEVNGEAKVLRMHIAVKVLAMSLIIAMILSYVAIMVGVAPASTVPVHVSYTSHATILINGNANFATKAAAESWLGDGSLGDPYIIAGYDIDAISADGICIENTNVHFNINDCYVHNGGSSYSGISLYYCANGTISSNNCSNNHDGIFLYTSSNNIVSSNNCSNNAYIGIFLGTSSNNIVSSNNCSSNTRNGIHLGASSNNIVSSNNCSSNDEESIFLDSSNGNTLINNTCSNNAYYGIYHANSNNNTLINNTCSNNAYYGIFLGASSNNTLSNNTCSTNVYLGIRLRLSNNNTVSNNTCSNNVIYGIYLDSSSDNTLINDNCSNNGYGIYLDSSSNNTLINDNCSNNGYGIYLDSSSNNIVSSNNCSNNSNFGIYLESSRRNTLSDNNCSNNWLGIEIYSSSNNNVLTNNICSKNDYGVYLESSSNNNILTDNNCSSNNFVGISIGGSSDNTIIWNQLYDNLQYGIYIYTGTGTSNGIWNNKFYHNNGAGDTYDPLHIQAYDDGANNRWEFSGYGNLWSDWTTPDVIAPFGIIDIPYNISGSAGAKDHFPLLKLGADLYPPVTTASLSGTLGTSGWYRSTVTVSLGAIDDVSGVNATFYRIGTSGSWLNYTDSFVLSSDGKYTIQFYSMDNSSNNEPTKSIAVKIDKTNPTLSINQTTGFEVTADYTIISWLGSDATSGIDHFEVKIDGGAFASVGMAMSHNFTGLANGMHNVTVKSVDKAGNTVEQIIQFTVNTSAPSGGSTSSDLTIYIVIILILIVAVIVTIFIMMNKGYIAKIVMMMKKKP